MENKFYVESISKEINKVVDVEYLARRVECGEVSLNDLTEDELTKLDKWYDDNIAILQGMIE